MNIKEAIEKRFSVRAFTKEVPDIETIKAILKTAGTAPSGGNIQPWKVYVLTENAKNELSKKTLYNFDNGVQEDIEYDIYPKPLADEYKKRRYECGADMYNALAIGKDDLDSRFKQIRENYNFFGAPLGMIITIDKSFGKNGWGHVGMFLENLWLSAIDYGLGICLQESWSIYPKTVKEVTKHPDNEIVWCGVAVGYEDSSNPINQYRTKREDLDSFVKFID
ncbi:MAG: nitroreductase [Gammaproteobacteria bacterium]|jgi:nitroreductase|tara:strand:+ start:470 stop:1135 length:666 start_codon:yes stop_codon:yes gene_type:complete